MDLKMHVYSVPLRSHLGSPASLGILRWGNASDQKLEVGELRSPASYYTLTTAPGGYLSTAVCISFWLRVLD